MVGSSLALALAGLSLKITLVEQELLTDKPTTAHDDRGIALSLTSQKILNTLGIWREVNKTAAPIKQIHVSEKLSFAGTVLKTQELNIKAFGYVCSGIALGRIINANLDKVQNIRRITPGTLKDLDTKNQIADIISENPGLQIKYKVIIGADGAYSRTRELAGIDHEVKDYRHSAITGNLEFSKNHDDLAFERFTPDGPMAVLPLQHHKSALIWTMPNAKAKSLSNLNLAEFKHNFYQEFGYRLGAIIKIDKIKTYPLRLVTAQQIVKKNTALIGNAAQTLHPVAGQGFNLGLRDMANLYENIRKVAVDGTALESALARYEKSRLRDRDNIIFLSDGLVNFFTNNSSLFKLTRRLGLLGFSAIPLLRKAFANWAMGKTNRASRLERGLS